MSSALAQALIMSAGDGKGVKYKLLVAQPSGCFVDIVVVSELGVWALAGEAARRCFRGMPLTLLWMGFGLGMGIAKMS